MITVPFSCLTYGCEMNRYMKKDQNLIFIERCLYLYEQEGGAAKVMKDILK